MAKQRLRFARQEYYFCHLNRTSFVATTKLLIGNILCCHDNMSRG